MKSMVMFKSVQSTEKNNCDYNKRESQKYKRDSNKRWEKWFNLQLIFIWYVTAQTRHVNLPIFAFVSLQKEIKKKIENGTIRNKEQNKRQTSVFF